MMVIREATIADKVRIIALYRKSQAATGLPDPLHFPPETLGMRLYDRKAVKRYVAEDKGTIIGHGMVELPNPENIQVWNRIINNKKLTMLEIGGAFVDPERSGEGIWSKLLQHRINYVKSVGAVPVSVTWSSNDHVKRTFYRLGGVEAGTRNLEVGSISLFVL